MVVSALIGAAVNDVAIWQVARANRENLNMEGSFRHLVTDFSAFTPTVVDGTVIWTTGSTRRPGGVTRSGGVDARRGPALCSTNRTGAARGGARGMRTEEMANAITRHPGVASLHDLHVSESSSGLPSLSTHVLVDRDEDCPPDPA